MTVPVVSSHNVILLLIESRLLVLPPRRCIELEPSSPSSLLSWLSVTRELKYPLSCSLQCMDGWMEEKNKRMLMMMKIRVGVTKLNTHLVPAANAVVASVSIPSQFKDAPVAAFRIRCCSSCCSAVDTIIFCAAMSISVSSSFILHASWIGDESVEDINLVISDDMDGTTFRPCLSLIAVSLSTSVRISRIIRRRWFDPDGVSHRKPMGTKKLRSLPALPNLSRASFFRNSSRWVVTMAHCDLDSSNCRCKLDSSMSRVTTVLLNTLNSISNVSIVRNAATNAAGDSSTEMGEWSWSTGFLFPWEMP